LRDERIPDSVPVPEAILEPLVVPHDQPDASPDGGANLPKAAGAGRDGTSAAGNSVASVATDPRFPDPR
jgi:hypothetical protein